MPLRGLHRKGVLARPPAQCSPPYREESTGRAGGRLHAPASCRPPAQKGNRAALRASLWAAQRPIGSYGGWDRPPGPVCLRHTDERKRGWQLPAPLKAHRYPVKLPMPCSTWLGPQFSKPISRPAPATSATSCREALTRCPRQRTFHITFECSLPTFAIKHKQPVCICRRPGARCRALALLIGSPTPRFFD